MATIGELRQQVEAEPDQHEARWRLAKMLFASSDYREALIHLRILKEEWETRLNVLRYLGATYFRLGRFDEAAAELQECLETWPDELSIREQLAKVFEAAGRQTDAIRVWGEIRERDPDNRMARKALQRLTAPVLATPNPLRVRTDSDDGIDLRPVTVCGHCGAQNSAEFERCWQCGASLTEVSTPPPARKKLAPLPLRVHQPSPIPVFALGALVLASVVVSLLYLPPLITDPALTEPPLTVADALNRALGPARLILWGAMTVLCAFAASIMGRSLQVIHASAVPCLGFGLGVASAYYLTSWLPVQYLPFAWGAVLLGTLAFTPSGMLVGFGKAFGIWAGVSVAAALTAAVVITVYMGPNAFQQALTFGTFAAKHDAQAEPGVHPPLAYEQPTRFFVEWQSSGAPALDSLLGDTAVVIHSEPVEPPITFVIYEGTGREQLAGYIDLTEPTVRLRAEFAAGTPYECVWTNLPAEPPAVEVVIQGVLTPVVSPIE